MAKHVQLILLLLNRRNVCTDMGNMVVLPPNKEAILLISLNNKRVILMHTFPAVSDIVDR